MRWLIVIIWAATLSASARDEVDSADADLIGNFFSVIQARSDGVNFTVSDVDSGIKYQLQIGNAAPAPIAIRSSFTVPYGTAFRLLAHTHQICFLPLFEKRHVKQTWLVEVQNRVGDVYVALFGPAGTQVVVFPLNVATWESLASFEHECTYGAGITSFCPK